MKKDASPIFAFTMPYPAAQRLRIRTVGNHRDIKQHHSWRAVRHSQQEEAVGRLDGGIRHDVTIAGCNLGYSAVVQGIQTWTIARQGVVGNPAGQPNRPSCSPISCLTFAADK